MLQLGFNGVLIINDTYNESGCAVYFVNFKKAFSVAQN